MVPNCCLSTRKDPARYGCLHAHAVLGCKIVIVSAVANPCPSSLLGLLLFLPCSCLLGPIPWDCDYRVRTSPRVYHYLSTLAIGICADEQSRGLRGLLPPRSDWYSLLVWAALSNASTTAGRKFCKSSSRQFHCTLSDCFFLLSITSIPPIHGRRTRGIVTFMFLSSQLFSRMAASTRGTANAVPLSV